MEGVCRNSPWLILRAWRRLYVDALCRDGVCVLRSLWKFWNMYTGSCTPCFFFKLDFFLKEDNPRPLHQTMHTTIFLILFNMALQNTYSSQPKASILAHRVALPKSLMMCPDLLPHRVSRWPHQAACRLARITNRSSRSWVHTACARSAIRPCHLPPSHL